MEEFPSITQDEILLACEECIKDNDSDSLFELLESLDFDNMSLSESRILFYYLIDVSFRSSREQLVPVISDYFSNNLVQKERIEAYLFSEPSATPDVLDFYFLTNG